MYWNQYQEIPVSANNIDPLIFQTFAAPLPQLVNLDLLLAKLLIKFVIQPEVWYWKIPGQHQWPSFSTQPALQVIALNHNITYFYSWLGNTNAIILLWTCTSLQLPLKLRIFIINYYYINNPVNAPLSAPLLGMLALHVFI